MVKISQIIPVNVDSLQELPVQTKNISEKLIKIISDTAKTNLSEIQPILVGKVNSVLYAINDFETVRGLKQSKIQQTNAFIIDYATMPDLIIAHVRQNFYPHTIDPLRIRQVIDYMIKSGMDESKVCKQLWLDKRPELFKIIRADIADDARKILLDLTDKISQKIYSVVTPTYYVSQLAKIEKGQQCDAAKQITAITQSKMGSEKKFSWPSFDTITTILREFDDEKKIIPTMNRIAKPVDIKDLKKSATNTSKTANKDVNRRTIKKAEKYISTDPNLIYVPLDGPQPDLVLNKKTGRVAKTKETNSTYSMTDDLGKSTHLLPNHAVNHLGLEQGDSILIYKYDTIEKAQNALAKAKDLKGKCVILSTVKLPRR